MPATSRNVQFVLCIDRGDADDREAGKVYQVLPDTAADKNGLLRVIDDSAEDYLYPKTCFVPLDLPSTAKKALLAALRPRDLADTKRPR